MSHKLIRPPLDGQDATARAACVDKVGADHFSRVVHRHAPYARKNLRWPERTASKRPPSIAPLACVTVTAPLLSWKVVQPWSPKPPVTIICAAPRALPLAPFDDDYGLEKDRVEPSQACKRPPA